MTAPGPAGDAGPSGFEVLDEETLETVGFLGIDQLTVRGLDGGTHSRTVIRHPGAVVVVPVEPGGTHVLLVRQYRAAIDGLLLEVPAGKRDVDGEPPPDTAVRELDEEIGYRPGRLVKLAEFFNTPGFCDEYTHLYAAIDIEPTGGARPVGPEESAMTVERVALDDVEQLIASRTLVDAKSIIGLLLTRLHLNGDHAGIP